MKTKQEYIDALNRMVEVYDNLDGCMSERMSDDLFYCRTLFR